MSTLPEKVGKQFTYQRTVYATSGDPMDLFVSVDHLAGLFFAQMHSSPSALRRQVKDDLERRADAGEIRRWVDVHGPSLRQDRVDHYYLPEQP